MDPDLPVVEVPHIPRDPTFILWAIVDHVDRSISEDLARYSNPFAELCARPC